MSQSDIWKDVTLYESKEKAFGRQSSCGGSYNALYVFFDGHGSFCIDRRGTAAWGIAGGGRCAN